ncbi:MAG: BatA domain-containing protein [Deltaproteobacteria bacterium]|nr:BatA domain-containing protein [Deltaproteobacteria bacterium]
MRFLAPVLLLALVAAALPYLIHRVGKRRAVPVRFAAMQLLLRSERRVHARRRLREILLLVARTAAAASLPLVFARPFCERATDLPVVTLDAQAAVLILDDSASMQRRCGVGTCFAKAKARALALARQFPLDSELALLLASAGAEARIGELEAERARIVEAIEGTTCSARPADFTAAMRQAALLLAGANRALHRVYLFTDGQATGWEDGTGLPPASAPEVIIDDVTGGAPLPNRAILDARVQPTAESGPGGIAITVDIADYTQQSAPALGVTLRVDGAAVAQGAVELPAGGRARKRFLHAFPGEGGGSHDLVVSIEADAFPPDDRRTLHVEMARTLRVLAIDGDPRTIRNEDESFFFETAIKSGIPGALVTNKLADDVSPDGLSSYTVVALLNVAEPAPALAAALERFVMAGGGLFISMGDRVNAMVWNQRMARLLPQPLGLLRTAAALPGQRAGETLDERPAERLLPLDRRTPLLSVFPEEGGGLLGARFFKYVLLDPVRDTARRSVLLRFESGAPALVEGELGKGRVLLLTTTVDREWTDLPIRPGFLPLLREIARYLVGATDQQSAVALLVGEPSLLSFRADLQTLEIRRPDGSVWIAKREPDGNVHNVAFTGTDQIGLYRVRGASADGVFVEQPSQDFAVNLDPRESDPARLAPERRPDRLAAARVGAKPSKHRVELWHALSAVLLFLVLAESLLTLRRRRASALASGRSAK